MMHTQEKETEAVGSKRSRWGWGELRDAERQPGMVVLGRLRQEDCHEFEVSLG